MVLRGIVVWGYAALNDKVIHKRLDRWVIDSIGGGKLHTQTLLGVCAKWLCEDLADGVLDPATLDGNRDRVREVSEKLGQYVAYLEETYGEEEAIDNEVTVKRRKVKKQ